MVIRTLQNMIFGASPDGEIRLQDHEGDDDDEPLQTQPLLSPPRLPSRPSNSKSGLYHRARSISKVYDTVPSTLPSFQEMQTDVLEFLAHAVLLEANLVPHGPRQCALEDSLASYQQVYGVPITGRRLYNRMLLTAVSMDISTLRVETPAVEGHPAPSNSNNNSKEPEYSVHLTPKDWQRLREQLAELRSCLLQKSANTDGDMAIDMDDMDQDEQLATHEMFQADYDEVVELLHVQEILSHFRLDLKRILQLQSSATTTSTTPPRKDKESSKEKESSNEEDDNNEKDEKDLPVVKQIEKAVSLYEGRLLPLFQHQRLYRSKIESDPRSIPKVLNSFLWSNLMGNSGRRRRSAEQGSLVTSLLQNLDQIALDDNAEAAFSHGALKHKMRALLIKWSESVLEIPVLVRLGYGGMPSPVVEQTDQDDDVSVLNASDHDDHVNDQTDMTEEDADIFKRLQTTEDHNTVAVEEDQDEAASPLLTQRIEPVEEEDADLQPQPPQPAIVVDSDGPREPPPQRAAPRGPRTPRRRKRKLAWFETESDLSDIDNDDNMETTPTTPSRKYPAGHHKRRWTADETAAVREGLQEWGIGKWKEIAESQADRLAARSPGQIKDKYRTMVKRHEL